MQSSVSLFNYNSVRFLLTSYPVLGPTAENIQPEVTGSNRLQFLKHVNKACKREMNHIRCLPEVPPEENKHFSRHLPSLLRALQLEFCGVWPEMRHPLLSLGLWLESYSHKRNPDMCLLLEGPRPSWTTYGNHSGFHTGFSKDMASPKAKPKTALSRKKTMFRVD